ncbi:MAG: group II intron reverse transcriptase/maturase [bacterium]|nr:group II intron reverse transcriptase/maturase [bacterium]
MIKAPIQLQELRRRIYVKAKSEPSWRFWGLYVHVCKEEVLHAAYQMAKKNKGASGIDGVTFEAVEAGGVHFFLGELRKELTERTYRPQRARKVEIPKDGGKTRLLSIPTIRDRVVQGALKLILEPIFEADFQPGSFGYRPKKSAHDAVLRVSEAIARDKTHVIDLDLRAYFDTVRHQIVLDKVAKRVNDTDVMHLLKLILKASGKLGVPQGGVISPLLSNVYLNEVDRMLERAKAVTQEGKWAHVEYARFADDLVVLVSAHPRHEWLRRALARRLREEFVKLQVEVNEEKTHTVELSKGESFGFLGFEFHRVRSRAGRWMPLKLPQRKKRTQLQRKLKDIFRHSRSRPVGEVITKINPILRGWVNYFACGNSSQCFSGIQAWVEKKIRRHLGHARQRQGFGWKRWSRRWMYEDLGLFSDYRIRYLRSTKARLV